MSIFRDRQVACPRCGRAEKRELCLSLNAPRRPDVVRAIVDDQFQRFQCGACGDRFCIDGPLLYLDFEAKVWIAAFPRPWVQRWRALEKDPAASFAEALGEGASPPARAMADGFRVRATFGLDGLRDKLRCFSAGFDDGALEALKMEVAGAAPEVPLSPGVRLELLRIGEHELTFAVRGTWEEGELTVPRARLDAIAADPEWARLRRELSAGPFVSMERLLG